MTLMRDQIGALGCSGVDLEAWRKANTVPLFPGRMNHWVLVRTLRDQPSESDLNHTLYAVMNKWFKGAPIDPALDTKNSGGRAGPTDNIKVIKTSSSPILLPNPARRRESLPGPMPTLNAEGGFVYVAIEFAYRGIPRELPWPVRTAPGMTGIQLESSAECIFGADWMLAEAGQPGPEAPPERSAADVIAEKFSDILVATVETAVVTPIMTVVKGLFLPIALGLGAWFVLRGSYERGRR